MRYDITVTTMMDRGDSPHFRDVITFYSVGEAVKAFVAESCNTVLMKLVNLPDDLSEEAYTLWYRTEVHAAGSGELVSDTTLVEFPKIDKDGAIMFKLLAVDELKATVDLINMDLPDHLSVVKRRSKLLLLAKLLFGKSDARV